MYMKKRGMKRNREGGGVLNLTSTTTVAMNKVVDEITVCIFISKTQDGYKKMTFPLQSIKRGTSWNLLKWMI
ncbi:hypothetical protein HID58_073870 [Brassica napus]|uniref:Uncharacterized protein n=1 Tax=Brassica napus TaxID=3708 RepID=A0ABQ7YHR6_BRANA|nr:hypothetical protein HID58_073870 [Brassica napus]